MEIFRLSIPILMNTILVIAVYCAEKYTSAKKWPYMVKQVVIGVLFGAVSAFSSDFGVVAFETKINVRDTAPLTSGLIFGGPAGIIAGLIGGLYRWFSVYWGAGTTTRLACMLATIFAGVMAAGLRKLMFDNKKPTWGYGVCIAVVCEVIHMILIFVTNLNESVLAAFNLVKRAAVPMIISNAIGVGLAIIVITVLSHERLKRKKGGEQIAQTFQKWLLVCIVVAYLVTSVFTYVLQNDLSEVETQNIFTTAITDVVTDVRGKSDAHILGVANDIKEDYEKNPQIPIKELAEKHNVIEINIVQEDGLITNSTDETLTNSFNMNSTEQSAEFMVLTKGQKTFVQQYGAVGSDNVTMRKFAGVALDNGGYIQVGYSAEQFHSMIDGFVIDVTKNRHVGTDGFVAVCDENFNMVTEDEYNGKHIRVIGIEPDERMLNGKLPEHLGEAVIVNEETDYEVEYIYAYSFAEGYCIIAAMTKEEAMAMRDASLYTSVFMQVLIFATLFLFIYILIKKVIINNLKKINSTLSEITEGNLNVTVDVRSNEEFASLSDDINSTVATLKQYISEAAARIDKELEYAKQIQHSALPTNFPDNENYELYAQMIPAKEVGGDFYDFYKLNDSTVAFLAADVSGKGIPAAMFMMTAKTIIKDLAERGLSVDEIFTLANEKLCENNESGMFVTAWMGILDVNTGVLKFANAGHNPPLLKKADGEFEYLKTRAGFVLAGMEGIKYRINEITLSEGDRLFLYTDGVPEATDTENLLYGEDRLAEFMNSNKSVKATELLPALKENIDEFVGEAPQFDDITMLMFDYKKHIGGTEMISKTFPAKVDALNDVLGFIESTLEELSCPMKTSMAIGVAIEEVFVNVAHYAYEDGEGDVDFSIGFNEADNSILIRMEDSGVQFDPLAKPDPDITLSVEEREIGGLGIFITKKTMDSLSYSYENGKNILTMIKKI